MDSVNYVLAIGTSMEIILIGVAAKANAHSAFDVQMFDTKMSINTRGLEVSVIEGAKNGRIFFGGRSDNELYEFTYRVRDDIQRKK